MVDSIFYEYAFVVGGRIKPDDKFDLKFLEKRKVVFRRVNISTAVFRSGLYRPTESIDPGEDLIDIPVPLHGQSLVLNWVEGGKIEPPQGVRQL